MSKKIKVKRTKEAKGDERFTPQELFDKVNLAFNFTLDAAAATENAKCNKFFTRKENGLSQPWGKNIVWVNPPYSARTSTNPGVLGWINKAKMESRTGATVVMLLAADTSTAAFEECFDSANEIVFLSPRVKFGGAKQGAKFGSMLVVFKPAQASVSFSRWNWKKQLFDERK